VSGSAIRRNPHAWRDQIAPSIYADFVQRVCLLGGESSGKTTLARELAGRFDTSWVPEYGRQRWEEQDGRLLYDDLLQIARTQLSQERELAERARRWLFCDTSPLTTLLYCRELFGRAEPELERLAGHRYDHIFLCAPDFPFAQDGTRRDDAFRHRQHRWYLHELSARGLPFTLLEGDLERRIAVMEEVLASGEEAPGG
jgi:NadR type nicotinamide-nucleotide adenylyltransferase